MCLMGSGRRNKRIYFSVMVDMESFSYEHLVCRLVFTMLIISELVTDMFSVPSYCVLLSLASKSL